MPLTNLHVINICKYSQGVSECRYLAEDEVTIGMFHCMKLSPQKQVIDDAVDKNKSRRPTQYYGGYSDDGTGDNCSGYPILRHKYVGYDKKD